MTDYQSEAIFFGKVDILDDPYKLQKHVCGLRLVLRLGLEHVRGHN